MQESGVTKVWEVARFNKLRGAVFHFLRTWWKPVCVSVYVCVKCIYRKSCHCQCSLTACWSWSHTSCLRLSGQFTSLLLT